MSNRLIVARERSNTRQHACDPSHARHSINNSIIVLDWITFWAEKIKKRGRKGGRGRQSMTLGAKRSERLSLRAMAHAFIKLFRFCIDLSIGRKKFIDDEISDLHDASVIRSLYCRPSKPLNHSTKRSHCWMWMIRSTGELGGKFYTIVINEIRSPVNFCIVEIPLLFIYSR